ncbi:fimbrial protein [Comamonas kerstersii]|nr:fimbrial protein [Comamonas kerstersii]
MPNVLRCINKLFFLLLYPSVVLAQGEIVAPSNITFQMPSITIPRDMKVGTVLNETFDLGLMQSKNVTCPFLQSAEVYGALAPGFTNVYKTNVPGVGVRFGITKGWNGGYYIAPNSVTANVYQPNSSSQQYRRVQYVVIDQVGQGTINQTPYMIVTYSGTCFPTASYRADIKEGVSVITPHTCAVLSNRVNVTLPDVQAIDLKNANSTAGDTNFSIGLNCTAGSKVYVTLTDKNDVGNRGSVLTLDKSSTASGVGIEILMNQKAVKFGPDSPVAGTVNQMLVGDAAPSLTSIPFTARYISKGNVKGGTVSATATFTMSYQ